MINVFDSVDFSVLPTAILTARIASVQTAIAQRLSGAIPLTAETFHVNGKDVTVTTFEYLTCYEAALYRGLAKQQVEPGGLGVLTTRFDGSGGGRSGGLPRNP